LNLEKEGMTTQPVRTDRRRKEGEELNCLQTHRKRKEKLREREAVNGGTHANLGLGEYYKKRKIALNNNNGRFAFVRTTPTKKGGPPGPY